MQGNRLTGWIGFAFLIGDESGSASGGSDGICLFDCAVPDPNLIRLLPGQEVHCGIRDISGIISRDYIRSPNVAGESVAASLSVCGLTTAGTFNSVVWYFISIWWKMSAASPHPGCVNSSNFICVWPKSVHLLLYHFRDRVHHPAGFIIFAQLALFWMFIIFPILLIVQTCKIAQSVSDSIPHLLIRLAMLSRCQSPAFSTSHIFVLLLNCCLCILNSLCCHSGVSLYVMLHSFLFLFVIHKVCFLSSLCYKVYFGSHAAQCT